MTAESLFCPKCNSKILDGARFCNHCGEKIGTQNEFTIEPAPECPSNAPEEYTLILKDVREGCHERVAKRLSELTKKDIETSKAYTSRLPLTLGKKFTREKAETIREYLEDAGAVMDCQSSRPATPSAKADEPNGAVPPSVEAKPISTHITPESSYHVTSAPIRKADTLEGRTDKLSPHKVSWFIFFTVGLYSLYWFYRTWVIIARRTKADFSPDLRTLGLFVPIVNLIMIEKMFTKDIELLRVKSGGAEMMKNRRFYVLSFVLYFLILASRNIVGIFPLFLVGLVVGNGQKAVNSYLELMGDQTEVSRKWSLKEIAVCSFIPALLVLTLLSALVR
jgi:ribosomal protein L7/L12